MKPAHIFFAVALLAITSPAIAQDARQIMVKVDQVANHSFSSSARVIQFTTCRYNIASGKLSCREKPRVIKVESVQRSNDVKDLPDRNNKAFNVIIDPVSDKGTATLSFSYAEDEKDSDFWIYLPALAKVKRIVSVSDSSESGALFGSELSTEDADLRKIKDYTYRLLGEEKIRERAAWKVELMPTAYRRTRSYYSKIVVWVDKERSVVLKEDIYDRAGRHYKQRSALDVERIDGVWIVTKGSMNNLFSKRITIWDESGTKLNADIDDEFLTQRSLTDFAYRERMMTKYRGFIKK
jgi:hypothetical protein